MIDWGPVVRILECEVPDGTVNVVCILVFKETVSAVDVAWLLGIDEIEGTACACSSWVDLVTKVCPCCHAYDSFSTWSEGPDFDMMFHLFVFEGMLLFDGSSTDVEHVPHFVEIDRAWSMTCH